MMGAVGGAIAGLNVLRYLGSGSGTGVASAQEGGLHPEKSVEGYWEALDERLDGFGDAAGGNAFGIKLSVLGFTEFQTRHGWNLGGGTFFQPTPEILADYANMRLQVGPEPYGSVDPLMVADYLASQYGPESPYPYFVEIGADSGSGRRLLVLTPDKKMESALENIRFTIPYSEVLVPAREAVRNAQPQAGGAEQIAATIEPAKSSASPSPVSGAELSGAPPPLVSEARDSKAEKRNALIAWILGGTSVMLTSMGLGWLLVGRKGDAATPEEVWRDSDKWSPPRGQDVAGGVIERITNKKFPNS
jgi:hypothetical protein